MALDLGSAAEVPLTFGTDLGSAAENAATGGTLTSGDYVADVIEIDQTYSGLVSGSAAGIVELTPATATAGAARVSLAINAMALGNQVNKTLSGAGTYTITNGHVITISDAACGGGSGSGSNALPTLYYTATGNAVTFWTTYVISGLSVDLKVHVHQ